MNKQPWDIDNKDWTNETLKVCTRWWADELALRDWTFNVKFASYRELDGHLARAVKRVSFLDADIVLLNYEERDVNSRIESDMEQDIVHELVHIRMWGVDEEVDYSENRHMYLLNEQAIDKIASALVKLRRGDV